MKPRWHWRWRVLAIAMDALFVAATLIAFTAARFGSDAIQTGFVPSPGRDFARAPVLFAIPVWLCSIAAVRLYSPQRCQSGIEETRRLVAASLGAAVALVMLGFLVKENPARSWLFGEMVLVTLAAASGRRTVRSVVSRLRERGRWMTPTVIVGRNQAKAVVEAVRADLSSGLEPVATCGFTSPGIPDWRCDQVAEAVRTTKSGEVLIVAEDLERPEVSAAFEVADEMPVHVIVLPGLDHLMLSSLSLVTVGNEPGLALEAPALHSYQAAIKRAFDLAASLVLLVLTVPVMVIVALAIKLESRGPVVFRQDREGRGEHFSVLKFRTMRTGVGPVDPDDLPPDDLSFLSKPTRDSRVTRVGYLLRRSSLDELPQLWNVVRGDMSLVGPRPLRTWEAERLGLKRRLVVRPGLTGLWQVSGRSALSAEERVRLDIVYVQNWSVVLDLSILLRTVPAVIGGRGAY